MSEVDTSLNCNFCGKNSKEVKKLVAGPDIYICDECVEICYDIIHDSPEKATLEGSNTPEQEEETVPSPRKIKEHLDQYVIGQDDAKETIAVAVYSHYKRLENIENPIDGVEIEKSNILMLGPTGSGKTLIAQSVAKMLNVPLAIADATSLTEAGYVGEDVESIITRLLQAANYNVKAAERGIVFIDEIDKKRGKEGGGASKDVSGEGVQQDLLKLLEGSDVMVPAGGKRTPGGELLKVNTRNILFIVGGAFVGLDKLIERTSAANSAGGIGFNSKTVGKAKRSQTEILRSVEPEHLVKYGLIPELIGRLPVYATLEELDEPQLVRILTEPKNALVRQFEAKFKLENVELVFTPEALTEVAKVAKERKTGARGLRSVVENCLKATQFILPELANEGIKTVIVTGKTVRGEEQPEHRGKEGP